MTILRLLMVATIYSVIILEVYSGVIRGPLWWIIPGVLVISLVGALVVFGDQVAPIAGGAGAPPSLGRWILIVIAAVMMAGFAYYFGREVIPDLLTNTPMDEVLKGPGE
ncbi:MAG: hypothetical protein GC152_12320 [Alphaproteobacteria bacterium]|nr:hypothetical protein [Alphaproteobacteria bacterium]